MLTVRVEKLSEMSVVECKGRLTDDNSVFRLRDIVKAQLGSPVVVLDLSEIKAIGGAGAGMLAFLDQWAHENDIHLKLFSPSKPVVDTLKNTRSMKRFEMTDMHELMGMLSLADSRYSLAA